MTRDTDHWSDGEGCLPVVSAAQMRAIDRRAIEDYGIPGIVLMENAGLRVAARARQLAGGRRGPVLILCGRGNNGGDGLVAARHLAAGGREVRIWLMAPDEDYRGEAAVNLNIVRNSGLPVSVLRRAQDLAALTKQLDSAGLVIDALLGTGATRPLDGLTAELAGSVNARPVPVLAVDLPSGVDADTGRLLGTAVQADVTLTLALPKQGLYLYPAAAAAGAIEVADIGIPAAAVAAELAAGGPATRLLAGEQVRRLLPSRPLLAHKGTFGRLLLVAGSPGMTGAAALAAAAALRGGAGLVYAATAASLHPVLESKLMEAIAVGLPESGDGLLGAEAAAAIAARLDGINALAIGPGMVPGPPALELLRRLLPGLTVPAVIDAGALSALAADPDLLGRLSPATVITPHAGELGRLLGITAAAVQEQRLELTRSLARRWKLVLVLKGAYTLIGCPDGRVFINPAANPVLATAGSGDLLTGLIGAFLAQGLAAAEAACLGVYVHAAAASLAAGESGRGRIAGDILTHLGSDLDI